MEEAIVAYFTGKPRSFEIFKVVHDRVRSFGPFDVTVKSQISFGVERNFAWFWLYNVTKKDPNGILHTSVRLDRNIDDPHVRNIEQISRNRWNHQVVIRTMADARSRWLSRLMEAAYEFGSTV